MQTPITVRCVRSLFNMVGIGRIGRGSSLFNTAGIGRIGGGHTTAHSESETQNNRNNDPSPKRLEHVPTP